MLRFKATLEKLLNILPPPLHPALGYEALQGQEILPRVGLELYPLGLSPRSPFSAPFRWQSPFPHPDPISAAGNRCPGNARPARAVASLVGL